MKDHVQQFRDNEVNGLSLWRFGVKNPALLRTALGITSEIKRATLTQVTRAWSIGWKFVAYVTMFV
jgi:hypothetical protein